MGILIAVAGWILGYFGHALGVYLDGGTNDYINRTWVKRETPLEKTLHVFTRETGILLSAEEKIEAARRYLLTENGMLDLLEVPFCPLCEKTHAVHEKC